MLAICISPGKSMRQLQQFLLKILKIYTKEGSKIFEKRFDKKLDNAPMILSGGFNISFVNDRNKPVIDFFQ